MKILEQSDSRFVVQRSPYSQMVGGGAVVLCGAVVVGVMLSHGKPLFGVIGALVAAVGVLLSLSATRLTVAVDRPEGMISVASKSVLRARDRAVPIADVDCVSYQERYSTTRTYNNGFWNRQTRRRDTSVLALKDGSTVLLESEDVSGLGTMFAGSKDRTIDHELAAFIGVPLVTGDTPGTGETLADLEDSLGLGHEADELVGSSDAPVLPIAPAPVDVTPAAATEPEVAAAEPGVAAAEPEAAAAEPEVAATEPEVAATEPEVAAAPVVEEATGAESVAPEAEPEATGAPEAVADPETQPQAEPQPEPEAQPESEAAAEPEAAVDPDPAPQAATEPKPEVEAQPKPEPEPEVEAQPKPEPEPEVEAQPQSEAAPESEAAAAPEVAAEPESAPEVAAEPEAAAEPEPEPIASPPAPSPALPLTPGLFNPMPGQTFVPPADAPRPPWLS
jgi:hypothetical protein